MKKKIIGLLTVTMVILMMFMSTVAVYAATALKITKQPSSVSGFAGDKVKVTVTAKGDGLTYKWYYKNKGQSKYTLVKNKNDKTYTATMKDALDGRRMYCVVKDKYGKTVKSEAVKFKLKEKAKIKKQPTSVIAPAGTKAKITVKASGDGLTYKWYYKNKGQDKYTLIKKKNEATYTVTMKDAISGRKMYCVVKDKYGNTVKSEVVKLTVGQTATITEQPSSVSVLSGKKAKFTVKAIGDGLTYKWYYKNKGQSKYTLIKDKNSATYTVKMKNDLDGRKLYCVVKDKYGTSVKTEVVTLKLGKTVKITAQPVSVAVKKGDTAVVKIAATGDGLSYNWYYKNKGQSKFTLISTKKDKTYTVTMKDAIDGRQLYCVVKDKYGTSVKSKVVTLTMGNPAEITKQPVSVDAKCGTKATVSVTAKGDGLTYSWYYKNEGDSKFTLIKGKTSKTYSVTMKGSLNGRELYCVVKDKYGSSVKSDVVILYAEHVYDKGTVTKEATCKAKGEKVYKCLCGDKKTEAIAKTKHILGSWKVVLAATVNAEGYERAYCKYCKYYKDRTIAKLPAKYYITLNLGNGKTEKVGVAKDGKYTLEAPVNIGYNFKGWKTSNGKDFASSGTVSSNITVTAQWELDGTDTFAELKERTDAGVGTILITKDITVTDALFIWTNTKIYSDGNFTLKRDPKYAGDIFVVGENREGKISTILGTKAVLNLGGGKGTLTVDGNKNSLKTTVVGSAVFVANSGTLNIYDGAELNNNKKLGNKRSYENTEALGTWRCNLVGGAAVTVGSGTLNMYGGKMSGNVVATEYTKELDTTTNTEVSQEYHGCGGAVYNNGNFNMYGGEISGNEALRGGGVYTDSYVYLDSGVISNNYSHSYGGAISSSSSADADIHIGTADGNKVMLIKDNHSLRAGGAVYSNTSSPIVIHGNTEFIGNYTDSSGGAIYTAGPLTIKDTLFKGNRCVYSGGAIYNHYTNAGKDRRYFTISDSKFVENNGGLGGAIVLSASEAVADKNMGTHATITNCEFTKNQAVKSELSAGNGGAIYITRKSDAIITGCNFTENIAGGISGALSMHSGSNVTVTDCNFTGNTSTSGGAMYASSQSVVKVTNAVVSDNKALLTETGGGGLGGGIYIANADVTLNNVDLHRNSAGLNGGAIYQNQTDLDIDASCEFIGNSADGHGGAFYLTYATLADGSRDGAVLNADGVLFKDNSAKAGGAISARSDCQANLNKVNLINNSASGLGNNPMGGGALYVGYGSATLTDVIAKGNTSADFGGVVNAAGSDVVVTGGEYTDNIALNGGAFSSNGATNLTFTNVKLNSNEANYVQTGSYNSKLGGGAINASGGTLSLDTVTLDGNSSGYYGGTVLASSAEVTIKNSTVKNSSGATGAALCFRGSCKTTITDTSVTDNVSKGNGVLYASGGTLDMTNVTAKGNTASSGGVLYASDATTVVTLNNSEWSGNSASSGGAVFFKDATVNVNNCTISGNSAKLGGAFYSEKGTVNIKKTSFTENHATQNGGAIDIIGTTANVSEDTSFTSNKADGHGGAVYVNYIKAVAATETTPAKEAVYGVLNVDGCNFETNAAMAGGAVSVRTGGVATFNGTAFTGNTVEGHDGKADGDGDGGGAIYVGFGTINLNGVTATNNEAKESLYVEETTQTTEDTGSTEGGATQQPEGKLYGFGGFLDGYQAKVYVDGGAYNNNKAPSGGAFYITGSSNVVSVKNAEFKENDAFYKNNEYDNSLGGGAFNISKATFTAEKVIFDGNKSGWYGGTVNASKCTVNFNDVTVTNSKGSTGSALHFKSGCTTTITNSEIKDNRSGYNGVIYANGGTLYMEKVDATNNQATNGGVIYTSGGSTVVTLKDNNFTENSATSGGVVYQSYAKVIVENCQIIKNSAKNGGAVYSESGKLEALNTNFSENSATANGGAVYVSNNTNAMLSNTSFNGNSAGNHGGAVDTVGSKVTATGTTFADNKAKNHGGAVYVVYFTPEAVDGAEKPANIGGTFEMTGGKFENNSALGGGAVSIRTGCEATLSDVALTGNTVEGYDLGTEAKPGKNDGDGEGGAAIYVGFGKLTLNDVNATNNEAKAVAFTTAEGEERLLSFGGVVDAYNSVVNVNGGTFSGNKAAAGGVIYSQDNKGMTINGAKFASNESTYVQNGTYDNNLGGGAVFVSGKTLTVSRTTFYDNKSAYYGGAIILSDVNASFDEGTIIANNSGATGGAVVIKGGSAVSMLGTVITDNTSSSNGVVYVNSSKVTMDKVTASGNKASKGGVIYTSGGSGAIDLIECKLMKNSASSGGVAFTENSAISFTKCNISENSATNGGVAYSNKGTATINFTECEITKNTASTNGGVVYSSECETTIGVNSCELSANSAKKGGVIFAENSASVSVDNSVFTENKATGIAGAIYVGEAGAFNLSLSEFNKNSSVGNGGAVYVEKTAMTLKDTAFTENSTTAHGGAINNLASVITATGENIFTANKAKNHGGAIYLTYIGAKEATETEPAVEAAYSVLNMTGGKFENNSALGGGAVSVRTGCEATLTDTVITGNTVEGYDLGTEKNPGKNDGDSEGGAAFYVGYGTLTLNNVTATGNEAKATLYTYEDEGKTIEKLYSFGGVIDAYKAKAVTVNGGTFSGNKAATGGVIFAKDSPVTVTGAQFVGNESTYDNNDYDGSCGGGAIAIVGKTLTIDGATFDGNKSDWYGGAVHATGTTVSITNASEFRNNIGATGAAIYFKDGSKATIDNTKFTENKSSYNSVVYTSSGRLDMTKVTATGNSAAFGGTLYVGGSAVATVAESTFANNSATDGGAIYLKLGTLTVSDSTFTENTAKYGAAIFATENGDLNVSGSEFTGNTATSNGGAIYIKDGASSTVTGCTFTENNAKSGAAIFALDNSNLEVNSSTFTENNASSLGGAIFVEEAATFTVNASEFIKNHSKSNGGAIYVFRTPLTLADSTFTENSTEAHGGAVNTVGSVVTATGNNTFTSNKAKNHGGAIYVTYINKVDATETTPEIPAVGGVLNMTGGKFENNSALGGGAVSIRSGCEATLTDTVITGNTVEGYDLGTEAKPGKNDGNGEAGGAFYVGFGTLTLNNVTATGNEAKATAWTDSEGKERLYGFGGMIDAYYATVNVNGGTVSGNAAPSGGAVYAKDSTVTIKDAKFENNESNFDAVTLSYINSVGGGAINIVSGDLNISGTTFDGNKSGYYGGTIIANSTNTVIEGNTVVKNSDGATGAALSFIGTGSLTMKDSSVIDNAPSKTGSGIFYVSGPVSNLTNVTFSGNKANIGVIYTSGSADMTIENSAFTSNSAKGSGGAIDFRSSGTLTVKGTSFTSNTAKNGGAVYTSGKAKANIENCTFTTNSATVNGGAINHQSSGAVNVTSSSFESNSATGNGGAIYALGTGLMTVTDCNFKQNTAASAGAIYADTGASVTVSGGTLEGNTVTGNDGGAIYVSGATVNVTGATFTGNTAKYGAALYGAADGNLEVSGSTFTENETTGQGGAIFVKDALTFTVNGSEFTKNQSKSNGGAIHVEKTPMTLTDTVFTENSTDAHGGAINNLASVITATGENIFTANKAKKHGGAIYLTYIGAKEATETEPAVEAAYSVLNMTGGKFENNSALGGGAVSVRTGCEATLTDTVITGNTVEGYDLGTEKNPGKNDGDGEAGAAFYVGFGTLTLNNVTATNNEAKATLYTYEKDGETIEKLYSFGGVIDAYNAKAVTVNGGTFSGNKAATGGVIFAKDSPVTVTGAQLINNESTYDNTDYDGSCGGGAIATVRSTLTVDGATIDGGVSDYYGGAIHSTAATVEIRNGTVIKNSSGATGAALYFKDGCKVTITDTTLTDNKGNFNGVIYSGSGPIALTRVTATGNEARNGGVLCVAGGATTATVTDCTFKTNNATAGGGALFVDKGANATVSGGTFDGNTASGGNGGAIQVADSSTEGKSATTLNIMGTTLQNNVAVTGRAGAIATDTDSPNLVIKAENCKFIGNSATKSGAGAVVIQNKNQPDGTDPTEIKIVFKNCEFTNNTASASTGGAIEIRTSSVAKFDGIKATGNVAKDNGGAIYVTSNFSRVYVTGNVESSGNLSNGSTTTGTFIYMLNISYSNPPTLYTTASSDAAWLSQVGRASGTGIVTDMTTMP